jgi:hypothetical protein
VPREGEREGERGRGEEDARDLFPREENAFNQTNMTRTSTATVSHSHSYLKIPIFLVRRGWAVELYVRIV